ncbi:MAG TPA: DUF3488 domain-containing protein, partial [Acidimicrobiales bacterium]|nr:DUF3488 domain-containing protein [Acidimicrobiales bacterium]
MTALTELRPLTISRPDPGRPGADRPDEHAGPEESWAVEAALWVLVGTTLLDFHRCFQGWGADWMGPILVTGLGVLAVCRLTRRHISSPLVGSLIDLAAVVLLTVWTVVPSSTTVGIPTGATVRTINAALEQVVPRFAATSPPVDATTGYLVLAVAGTGAVALLSSWLSLRIGRPLVGAVPAFAGYVVCGSIGTRSGRIWSTILFVLAIGGFLLVARATRPRPPGILLGPAPTGLGRSQVGGGLAILAAVTTAAGIVAASAAGPNGHGPLGWNSIQQSNTRIVISPLVTLRTRLLNESGRDVFTVSSTQPSYWRITSLNNFDGGTWNAQDKYSGVDGPLPGITKPRGTRQVTERFEIQDLAEPWAPLAFDPETVTGAGHVSYDPRSGSLLTPHPTSNGLR